MSDLTVTGLTIEDDALADGTYYVRFACESAFTDSLGVEHVEGSYQDTSVTCASGRITAGNITIASTTDSIVNQFASYTVTLRNSAKRLVYELAQGLPAPAVLAPVCAWAELQLYSAAQNPLRDDQTYSKTQTINEINLRLNVGNPATTSALGRVKMASAPVDAANPKAVDDSDPRLSAALTSTKAALPTAGTNGRLRRVTDDVRGVWIDTGVQWASVVGEVVDIKRDFHAIGDGSSHPLSTRYATLADAQAVYPHATSLTNEIDWCALQGGLNLFSNQSRSGKIYVPGRYVANLPLIYRGNTGYSLDIEGQGMGTFDGSVIKWNGASGQTMLSLLGAYNVKLSGLTLAGYHLTTPANGATVTLLVDYDYSRSQGCHNVKLEDMRVYAGGLSGTKGIQLGTSNLQASEIKLSNVSVETGSATEGTDDYGIWTSNSNVKNFFLTDVNLGAFKRGIYYQGSGMMKISGATFAYSTVCDIQHDGGGTLVVDGAETEGSRAAYVGPGFSGASTASLRGWMWHGQLVDLTSTVTFGTVVNGGTGSVSVENSNFELLRVLALGGAGGTADIEPRFNTSSAAANTGSLTVRHVNFQNGSSGNAPIYVGGGANKFDGSTYTHEAGSSAVVASTTRVEVFGCTAIESATGNLTVYPNYRTGEVTITPIARVAELGGLTGAPSIFDAAGAGTIPTVSVSGNYLSGLISVTTGSGTPAANSVICQVQFGGKYLKSVPRVLLTPANANAAALSGATQVFVDSSLTDQQNFYVKSGATGLATATLYRWAFFVVQ